MDRIDDLKSFEALLVKEFSKYQGTDPERKKAEKKVAKIRKAIAYFELGGSIELAQKEIAKLDEKLLRRQDERQAIEEMRNITEAERKEKIASLEIRQILEHQKFLKFCISGGKR